MDIGVSSFPAGPKQVIAVIWCNSKTKSEAMARIDLNADMGESFGAYTIGNDADLLKVVTSANIACGFHGGDPAVIDNTIRNALAEGVVLGAHPGFNDLAGFGRRVIRGDTPEQITKMIIYQIGAVQALARANDCKIEYVKLHGSLANMATEERPLADAFLAAITSLNDDLHVMAMPMSEIEASATAAGQPVISEAYADRAYLPNGMLAPRSQAGAVIHDAETAVARVLGMIEDDAITAIDGTKLSVKIDSICVHGDNPSAIAIAETIRNSLEKAGVSVISSLRTKSQRD